MSRKMTLEKILEYPDVVYVGDEIQYKYVLCKESMPEDYSDHIVVYAPTIDRVDEKLDKLGVDAVQYYYCNPDKNWKEIF